VRLTRFHSQVGRTSLSLFLPLLPLNSLRPTTIRWLICFALLCGILNAPLQAAKSLYTLSSDVSPSPPFLNPVGFFHKIGTIRFFSRFCGSRERGTKGSDDSPSRWGLLGLRFV